MTDVMDHNANQLGEARRRTYQKQKSNSVASNFCYPSH
jgi:hypothetical protein